MNTSNYNTVHFKKIIQVLSNHEIVRPVRLHTHPRNVLGTHKKIVFVESDRETLLVHVSFFWSDSYLHFAELVYDEFETMISFDTGFLGIILYVVVLRYATG